MWFNSLTFLIFLTVFLVLWPLFKKRNESRWAYLLLSSLVFYAWWDWRFLLLVMCSGLLDFYMGHLIANKAKYKKYWLYISIIGNLGCLMFFKYTIFIAENLDNLIFSLFGLETHMLGEIKELGILLPLGISFYTFQSLSYTIDIYKGRLQPAKNLTHFFAYLIMFPQLIAGPIIRASDMLGQLTRNIILDPQEKWQAFKLVVLGFFQKMVIADNLAPYVDKAFANSNSPNSVFWIGILACFAIQMYYDFSGYSNIAKGIIQWLGYDTKKNFNFPYASKSMSELWTRWHISMTSWFRDYVYKGLGGARKGRPRHYINLWVTMTLSGLWHGASWNFVIFGALQAFYMSLEQITKYPKYLLRIPFGKEFCWLLVILQVLITMAFFRSETLEQATFILTTILDFNFTGKSSLPTEALFYLCIGFMPEVLAFYRLHNPTQKLLLKFPNLEVLLYACLIFLITFFRGPGSQFIYFNF